MVNSRLSLSALKGKGSRKQAATASAAAPPGPSTGAKAHGYGGPRSATPVLSSSSEDGDGHDSSTGSESGIAPTPSNVMDSETYLSSLKSLRTTSRAGSTFSLSRHTLSGQMKQLRGLTLPDPKELSTRISAIPAAVTAAETLSLIGQQIRTWLKTAAEVLRLLDAEDDTEWAITGGKDGLGEVDVAVKKFEGLIGVYVAAIEALQERKDASDLPPSQLKGIVDQMELILGDWELMRRALKVMRQQVELAMEFEGLWNTSLGDIGVEVTNLSNLVREMEIIRESAVHTTPDVGGSFDVQELDTIVEESVPKPGQPLLGSRHFKPLGESMDGAASSPSAGLPQDDSALLALFARMQPLRASLDFLPMTLANYQSRAAKIFPRACLELEDQKNELEMQWVKLDLDAQQLREELSEDRWIHVFRNAGRQAQKLCESVERSLAKLQESIDVGLQHGNPPLLAKKIETYEAKKDHYGPAITKVLAIINKGVNDRRTVNHEVLRVQQESSDRWSHIEEDIKAMDLILDSLSLNRNQQLRDSISTIVSVDRSATTSMADNTPHSSPASSVIMASQSASKRDFSPGMRAAGSRSSSVTASSIRGEGVRRQFNASQTLTPKTTNTRDFRKPSATRVLASSFSSRNASPSPYAKSSVTPTPGSIRSHREVSLSERPKPRWNSSAKVEYNTYSSKPQSYPYSHKGRSSASSRPASALGHTSSPSLREHHSSNPHQSSSPLSRTSSPLPPTSRSRLYTGARSSLGMRSTYQKHEILPPMPLSTPPTSSHSTDLSFGGNSSFGDGHSEESPSRWHSGGMIARPPSAMAGLATGKRSSMLPLPVHKK